MGDEKYREEKLAEITLLVDKSMYDHALSEIQLIQTENDFILQIELDLIKCEIYRGKDEYVESLMWADNAITQLNNNKDPGIHNQDLNRLFCGAYTAKAYASWLLNEFSAVEDNIEYAKQKIGNDKDIPDNFKSQVALLYKVTGLLYASKGDTQKDREYSKLSLKLFEETNNTMGIAGILFNTGVLLRSQGELDSSMEHFQRALELYENHQNKSGIAVTQLMIATVYRRRGESEKELNQLQLSLKLSKESGSKIPLAWTLNSTAAHYQEKGDFKKALEYCFQSLNLSEEIGRPDTIVQMLGQIVELNSLLGEREKIPPLIEKIESYENKYPDIDIILISKYVKAIYLKSSKRARDKSDAGKIFDQIVSDEKTEHEFRMKSMMHLAELLLDELSSYGEDEVFQEINDLINRFIKFANKQNSVRPQIRALIIKAKLSIIEKDLQTATILLDEASKNAEDYNLGELTVEIQKEKHNLIESFEDMQKMIESNASYSERMNKMRIMDYVKQAQDLVNKQTRQ